MFDEGSGEHVTPTFPMAHLHGTFPAEATNLWTVPVAILRGGKDKLSNTDFLFRHLQRPPVLVLNIEEYEHLDFLWATGVSRTVNPAVIGVLESFARKSGVWEENVDRVCDPYDVERMWEVGSVRRDNGQLVLGGSVSVWSVMKECEERARIGAASPKKTPTQRPVAWISRTPPAKKSAENPKPSPVQPIYQVPIQTVRLSPTPSPPKPKITLMDSKEATNFLPPLAQAPKTQPGFFSSLTSRFASVHDVSDGESDDSLSNGSMEDADTYIIAG
jgi:hypothetical protein